MNRMKRARILLAAVLFIGPTTDASADSTPLGRLFFNAQQRERIDQQRQRNPWFNQNMDDGDGGLTLNGEVRSSSGRRTRWVNGEVDWNNTIPVPRVPVGNTYYPESGQTNSLLGGGRVVVRPAR